MINYSINYFLSKPIETKEIICFNGGRGRGGGGDSQKSRGLPTHLIQYFNIV